MATDDDRPDPRPAGGGTARVASWCAVAALFLVVGFLGFTRITDTDLWWHLASGDRILATREIPRHDPFSYTVPGVPWVDIHWLFQAGLALLHRWGGLGGLTVAKIVLAIALFGFLLWRGRRGAREGPRAGDDPAVGAGLLMVGALACQERFLLRPEIVSWCLLAIVLALIERALATTSRSGRRVLLWGVLPVLVALWANVQSLFVLAPVLIALALAASFAGWIRAPREARDPDRPIDLLVALALAALAALLNPYGARALRLPFEQFFVQLGGASLLSRTIAEFQPTLSGYLVTPALVAFGLFALLVAAALVADLRRVTLFEFLVALATLYVALRARRNVPIFVIATAPMLLRHAGLALGRAREALRRSRASWMGRLDNRPALLLLAPILVTLAGFAICLAAATDRLHLIRPTERWFGGGLIPHYFPDQAARFVATSGWPGNVFHSLSVGGFLIHAWKGDRRVFIDGRNDPYLDGVLKTYLEAVADPARFEAAARRYQVTAVLWPHQRAIEGRALLAHLERGGGWVRVHLDPAAAVYLRTDLAPHLSPASLESPPPGGPAVHAALAADLDAAPFDGPPIRDIALAEYFSAIRDPGGAEYFYRRALQRLPDSAPILHDCALAIERQGRQAEARALHEKALRADPGFAPSHAALGSFLIETGDLQAARRHLDRAWRMGDRGVRLLAGRARLLEKEGRVPDAALAWQEAIRTHPRNVSILRAAGAFFAHGGRPEAAVAIYEAARAIDPADPETAAGLIETLAQLGRVSEALIMARDAGRIAALRIETWARRTRSAAGGGSPGGLPPDDATGPATDRQVILWAARLEARSGHADRAAQWLGALARAGLLSSGDWERDPDLRAISPAR